MPEPQIHILLAAYNGAAHLRAQLDSLLAQDYTDFQVIVSDDGSSDETPLILDEYAAAHPARIVLYRSGRRFGSAQSHFWHLMEAFSDTPYLMFCDQDDIWHPNKIRVTMEQMRHLDTDPAVPCLVHTDLRVVSGDLQEIAPSFLRYSGLDGENITFNRLLVQNVVTGCTVLINRSLAKLALSAPREKDMQMHDWWLALLASACGLIAYVPRATIDYRQHGTNAVGAKNARNLGYILGRLRGGSARAAYWRCVLQARALLRAYDHVLPSAEKQLCRAFAESPDRCKASRLSLYYRCHLFKPTLPRAVGQILYW